jgi:hypothetical protein
MKNIYTHFIFIIIASTLFACAKQVESRTDNVPALQPTNADLSAGKSKGQRARGNIDSVTAEYKRQLDKDTDIGASISRGSSGGNRYGVSFNKRFDEGGKVKSKVNQAGVYTKPGMRKSLFESIKSQAVQGTGAGQWSARKAQLLAKKYKAKGGGYK